MLIGVALTYVAVGIICGLACFAICKLLGSTTIGIIGGLASGVLSLIIFPVGVAVAVVSVLLALLRKLFAGRDA